MRQIRIPLFLGALVLSTAGAAPGQTPQKLTLAKPDIETSESFTQITQIRELPSGKVLVLDRQDKVVQLVDLVSGSMTKVGREGGGPGEYGIPFGLVGLPDGTTLLQDLANRRFLSISPDGKPGAIVEMPGPGAATPPGGGGAGGPRIIGGFGITRIGGYDDRGRMYFEGSPFSADGGSVDSVPILRWDRVKPTFDTVSFRKLPPNSAAASQQGGNFTIRMGNNVRFTPTEAWGVAGDGSIARVFPAPYRVAWLSGRGPAAMGPVVPYTPTKVTEADKAEVLEAQRRTPPMRITIGGGPGGGGGGGGGGANTRNIQGPPPEFADTKPPYDAANAAAVQVAPEGEVWVLRTRPAGDKIPTYDVFNRAGALVKKVSLNPESRVVGFGKGTVYVVRRDQDDLQYLQRYKMP